MTQNKTTFRELQSSMSRFSLLSCGERKPGDDLGSSAAVSSSSGQLGSSAALYTDKKKDQWRSPTNEEVRTKEPFLLHSRECCGASQSNRGHLLEAPPPPPADSPTASCRPRISSKRRWKKPPAETGSFFRRPGDSEERLPPSKPRKDQNPAAESPPPNKKNK